MTRPPSTRITRRALALAALVAPFGRDAAAQAAERDAARLAELGIRVRGQPVTAALLGQVRQVVAASPERGAQWRDADMAILARLPELDWLILQEPAAVSAAGWQALARSRTLRLLNVRGARLDRAGVAAIASLPALEILSLRACAGVDDEAAALLARDARRLTTLDLSGTEITDRGVAALTSLPALTTLQLVWVNGLTDAGVARLAALRTLEALDLSMNAVGEDPRGFEALATLPALERLWLGDLDLAPGSIAAVARMPALRSLVLHGARIGDAELAPLATMQGLRDLRVSGPTVTDAAMTTVARMRGLTALDLSATGVGDAGVALLRPLSLARITLDQSRVGDRGIAALAGIPTLGWISARGTRVTPAGIAAALAVPGRHPSLRIER